MTPWEPVPAPEPNPLPERRGPGPAAAQLSASRRLGYCGSTREGSLQLEALPPQSGRTFHFRVVGNHAVSRGAIAAAVALALLFFWLLTLGVPSPPAKLSREARIELAVTMQRISTLAKAGTGTLCVIACLLVAYTRRAYTLHVEGDGQGGLVIEGGIPPQPRRTLPADHGPYRLIVLRKLRDDIPASDVPVDRLHLLARAQEDPTADSMLSGLLATHVSVVDGRGDQTSLLQIPEPLPGKLDQVMNDLRAASHGTLHPIRGGGMALQLPDHGKS